MIYDLEVLATDENFDEKAYLKTNIDVAQAVKKGLVQSGRHHFDSHGEKEGRKIRFYPSSIIAEPKKQKLEKIKPILRSDLPYIETESNFNFLNEEFREAFKISDTENVSSHNYDSYAMQLINENEDGFVLDCGAGSKRFYFDNVVNFEIVDYETTDVVGVGEVLPFLDNSFDAVLSIAVLEHVTDPFLCAKEIARVLKPGGRLICAVPFLQPFHAAPHHYYNMTHKGIENLFDSYLKIDKVTNYGGMLPIFAIKSLLTAYADGLSGSIKEKFMDMKISDFVGDVSGYMQEPLVKNLSASKNLEIAHGTILFATK